ncbi:hypothetical protein [Streptomyces pactum]|uniref:hypothetical protein n=1 Tax=Streptomyces pactum TaxID=68249 RepID=UPI00131DE8AB|nr:hypothetical protein [Streptomyces pactum]
MGGTESTGRGDGQVPPPGADPLLRQLLRLMAARCAEQDGPVPLAGRDEGAGHVLDSITAMELVSAWHRRGIETGFPELMAPPFLAARGRRAPAIANAARYKLQGSGKTLEPHSSRSRHSRAPRWVR